MFNTIKMLSFFPVVKSFPFILIMALHIGASHPAAAGEFVLVEEGLNPVPIILPENSYPDTRQAAEDLAGYIGKISGAEPEVIRGVPDPVPESAVWVGYQPALDELFPETELIFEHPEEILITASESHLLVAGRDKMTEGEQHEYGTANAVYTFLQDYLNVRWLWPGELGEDIIEQQTISFAPFEYRYHPQMRARCGVLRFSAQSGVGPSVQWTRFQRKKLDSLPVPGGHAFTDWWQRFHEDHPEYFALQPDGTRSGFPAPRTVKMCMSNPDVWEQWMADVEKQLQANPEQKVFNASPNDSWQRGWCICDDCRAWDHPEGEPRRFSWESVSQDYLALSDRHVTFANILAGMLRERYPDEDYYVMMTSYGHSRPVPVEAVPDDNVIISSVANFLFRRDNADRGSTWGTTHLEQFQGWGEVATNIVWRPNTGSPGGWAQGLPHVPITETVEEFKIAGENNTIGIFIDSVWEHWATQGPLYYIMAQLLWNHNLDAEAVMEDYYQRAFGPAEDEMKAYWSLLEETSDYDKEFLAKGQQYLDRALEAAGDGPEIYNERIQYIGAGLEYTRIMMDNRALMQRFRESNEEDAEAEQQVRDNWEKIGQLSLEYPNAVNWRRNEPRHGRTAGYHPDGRNAAIRLPFRE